MGSNSALFKATDRMRATQEKTITNINQFFVIQSFHEATLKGTLNNLVTYKDAGNLDLRVISIYTTYYHIIGNWDVQLVSEFVLNKTNIPSKSGKFLDHSEQGASTGEHRRISIIKVYHVT